jgi:hypothetical protein
MCALYHVRAYTTMYYRFLPFHLHESRTRKAIEFDKYSFCIRGYW